MQNILVVEDDYDLNQAICYSLKKSGYGVYGVTFMEKGKQTFIENQIDLTMSLTLAKSRNRKYL